MPKIYEYKGFNFFFYSNEHPPMNCHVEKGGVKLRFELSPSGRLTDARHTTHRKFNNSELNDIFEFIKVYKTGILNKWHTFWVLKKKPKFDRISRLKK
jgi:hypothetical protein